MLRPSATACRREVQPAAAVAARALPRLEAAMRILLLGSCALIFFVPSAADSPNLRRSPEYIIRLTGGQQVPLSTLRGNVVMLLFIRTDCPHCRRTCELMEKLKGVYGMRGFRPFAVAIDDLAREKALQYQQRLRLTLPVGFDDRAPVFSFLGRPPMQRTFLPIGVFIDRDGVIRGQYTGEDRVWMEQEKSVPALLEKLLNLPAGRARP